VQKLLLEEQAWRESPGGFGPGGRIFLRSRRQRPKMLEEALEECSDIDALASRVSR